MQRSDGALHDNSTAPRDAGSPAAWLHWIALVIVIAGAAIARFAHLTSKPFWFDECFSAVVARIGWGDFFRLLWWREANMSLYYVLLRAWMRLAPQPHEFFLRSLSVVIGVATLPATYWVARLLYNRRVALLATALLGFNAYHVRYSQEARSYTLLVLLATLSSGFLIEFVKSGDCRYRRAYVITSILSVYAHFYALLLVLAHWLTVSYCGLPEENAAATVPLIAGLKGAWKWIGLGALPILIFVAKTGAGPIGWIHRPGLGDLARFWIYFTGAEPLIYLLVLLVAALPGRKLLQKNQPGQIWRVQFLFCWLFFPIALTLVLSFARPIFLGRYMIFCLPALLILVAGTLDRERSLWGFALLAVALIFLSARFVPFVYAHDFDDERDASGAAANFILDHAQPGDGIVFHIAATRVPYEFFRSVRSDHAPGPEILFPRHGAELDYRDFTGKPSADFLRAVPTTHGRLWVMLMNNSRNGVQDPTTVLLTQMFSESFPKVERWQFPKVEVRLYSKP